MTDTDTSAGLSRRAVLNRSAAALGILLSGSLEGVLGGNLTQAMAKSGKRRAGYGPLVPDPDGLLSLPKGFSYKIVAQSGVTTLESGEKTPSDPDGTAAFVRHGGNGSVLVNNHEVGGGEAYPVPLLPGYVYDASAGGGTTTIEVDRHGNRVREYVSLAGTHNNCAGGRTPWKTWLTCEETEAVLAKPHGYVFEVDPYDQRANRDASAVPTRKQFAEITRSRKLEGMWWGDGGAYFVASFARTSDGSAAQHDGQVWFIDPRAETIELKLHFAYTPSDQDNDPDGPDNITVSPYGGVMLAEDGEGAQHLVGSTDRGEVFFFARNEHPDSAEFTGPTFSNDRKTLFANIQEPGYVFAIQGPFAKQR